MSRDLFSGDKDEVNSVGKGINSAGKGIKGGNKGEVIRQVQRDAIKGASGSAKQAWLVLSAIQNCKDIIREDGITDREIQLAVYRETAIWLSDNRIPARRANINSDKRFGFRIEPVMNGAGRVVKRQCHVTKTFKIAWKAVRCV